MFPPPSPLPPSPPPSPPRRPRRPSPQRSPPEQVDAWMHVLRVDASTGCMYSGGINWMHVLRRQLSKEIFGPFGTICRAFRSVNGKICCKKVEPAEEHRAPSSMLDFRGPRARAGGNKSLVRFALGARCSLPSCEHCTGGTMFFRGSDLFAANLPIYAPERPAMAKRPKVFRRCAPRDPPPDVYTRIQCG